MELDHALFIVSNKTEKRNFSVRQGVMPTFTALFGSLSWTTLREILFQITERVQACPLGHFSEDFLAFLEHTECGYHSFDFTTVLAEYAEQNSEGTHFSWYWIAQGKGDDCVFVYAECDEIGWDVCHYEIQSCLDILEALLRVKALDVSHRAAKVALLLPFLGEDFI